METPATVTSVEELLKSKFTLNGVSFPVVETTIDRGSAKGEVRYILDAEQAKIPDWIKFYGDEKVLELFRDQARSQAIATYGACIEELFDDPNDKTKVTSTRFRPDWFTATLTQRLSPSGPNLKELRELVLEVQSKIDPLLFELLDLIKKNQGGSQRAKEVQTALEPLGARKVQLETQIAAAKRS